MRDPIMAFRDAVLGALGHAPEAIEPGRFQRFATDDNRPSDDAGWCKMFEDLRGGVFGCYRQGISEIWSFTAPAAMSRKDRIERARLVVAATEERQAQQTARWGHNARLIADMWQQSVPPTAGDPVCLYLQRRGFEAVWPLPDVLRLHRAMPYWDEEGRSRTFPAMVAPVVAPDGRTVALHRTYLTLDGYKADVPKPKKLSGTAGPLAGACIPLHRPAGGCIGIAEGIETALAAWCASSVPTVASYCASNLASWRWPPGVERLVIFADADAAGRDAAEVLRGRAMAGGLRCELLAPTVDGEDWCDVWVAGEFAPNATGVAA